MATKPKPFSNHNPANLLKPASLFYIAIGLEILFMISPAALYFYSLYGPALNFLDQWSGTAWLSQFFLPHISTTRSAVLNALPKVGGASLIIGIIVFMASAIQIYNAKFRRLGLVTNGLYRYSRHPQYVGLALLGLGALLLWPRFLVLIAYVLMLFLYRSLAASEERRCEAGFGNRYREYENQTDRFLPVFPPWKSFAAIGITQPSVQPRRSWLLHTIATLMVCLALAFGLREYALANITAHYQTQVAVLSPALLSNQELLTAYRTALNEAGIRQITSSSSEAPLLVHVVPMEWHLADLPLETKSVHGGHDTPQDFDRHHYKVLFSRVRSHQAHAAGKTIVRSAYGIQPLRLVSVDIRTGTITAAVTPPAHVRWGDISTPLF
jgi:protein-S-isoprenylcysteine O-methyltransferase Ste14